MPGVDFDALKERVPLSRVLDLLQWEPTRVTQKQEYGPCPIHAPKMRRSRIFHVNGNGWYCWQCKTGGDVLALWGKLHDLDAHAAALDLCHRLGVRVPWLPRGPRRARRPRKGNREEGRSGGSGGSPPGSG
jgi:hypothetical protein